jgi:hypothetical protein
MVFMPEHPKATLLGFVGVHILEAEKMLGRPIQKGEIVHHRNFFKLDNSHENLKIMTREEHQQLPELQARYLIEHGLLDDFFNWWQEHKNDADPLRELEYQIAIKEEKVEYYKQKCLSKHGEVL